MQRLYRYWKSRLHDYYKECGDTYEERLDNPPDDFPFESWRACCARFNDDKFKVCVYICKENIIFSKALVYRELSVTKTTCNYLWGFYFQNHHAKHIYVIIFLC